jgi:hypothetical protein
MVDDVYNALVATVPVGGTFHANDLRGKVATEKIWKKPYAEALQTLKRRGVIEFTGAICTWRRLK